LKGRESNDRAPETGAAGKKNEKHSDALKAGEGHLLGAASSARKSLVPISAKLNANIIVRILKSFIVNTLGTNDDCATNGSQF
jgi:hypothetical protein